MILPSYYEFLCNVKTISGTRALERIPMLLEKMNARRPMIITDKGVVAAGLIGLVKKAMGRKITIGHIFDEVPVDSEYTVVNKAAAIFTKKGCDSLIAVGGGSPIDTAKGVNMLVGQGGTNLLDHVGAHNVKHKLCPFIVIPTTSGTGSEMTTAAVIANHEKNLKMLFVSGFLLPDIGLLDPRMTKTLPPHLTAATGMDALTHAMEAYYCLAKNPLSDSLAFHAIRTISENLVHVVKNPGDLKGRLALANAAAMAGVSFSNSTTGIVHGLGHATGGVCRVPHGNCMAIFLPYGMEYSLHKVGSIIGEMLLPMAGPEVYAATPKKERPFKVIELVRKLNSDLHEATGGRHPRFLKEIVDRNGNQQVPREALPDIAKTAIGDGTLVYNPEELTYDDALLVLEHAWEGTPLNLKKVKKGPRRVKW